MDEADVASEKLMPHQISFTDRAVQKTYDLMTKENNLNLKLRLFIVGGGCAGFQYGFAFDDTIHPDDVIIKKVFEPQKQDIYLLIDPISFLYLSKAEIDYVDDPRYARFVVHNPDVRTTCGCPRFQATTGEE